jgi:hypothetical protein
MHTGSDWADDDEAFFSVIRGRLSPESQQTVATLERVKAVYVECGRDKALRKSFDYFLENYLANRDGRRDEADVFFVTGESGAGKSAAIARLLRETPALEPMSASFGKVSPYVSVKLKGFTLPRIAARNIISAAGYPIRKETGRGDIWDIMAPRLKTRRTFLVHIDETQHLIKESASETEKKNLADAIKGVSIDKEWPVAFILSGLPSVIHLPIDDEQFERRGNYVHFTDVSMPDERGLVTRILSRMSEAGNLSAGALLDTDLPDRIAHAARYRYARICQVVLAAIHMALNDPKAAGRLSLTHFAKAFVQHSHAQGRSEMNPFIVENWAALPRGSFLIDPDREEA